MNEFNIKNGFISNSNSRVLGTLTATTLNIQILGSGTPISNLGIDSSGNFVTGTSGGGGTSFTGGTVTGSTTFTNGLSSNTISATTYYNLPIDIYTTGLTFNVATYDLNIVRNDGTTLTQNLGILASDMTITGGTYSTSTGIATFTNNTGGTFNVSGFLTGMTDTYTTGFTYNDNNTLTLKRNASQPDLNVLINTMSGLTVNGDLTATTISATTYFGLPIDVRTTGATYSNNTFNFTNNTGGTFNVLFNTVTGLTVNGSMSANHVYVASATTGTSVANLAIQSDGKIIKAGGNAIVDDFYYSVSNSVDTTFFEDDKVRMKWDETGNDLKFTMKVAPGGSGDMRSLGVLMGSTTTFNVAITTINVEYDLYSAGISAGNRMQAFVTAENDETYPAYHVTAYNTGESFHNTIWVQRITRI